MRGAIEKLAKEFNEHAAKLIAAPSKWELALKAGVTCRVRPSYRYLLSGPARGLARG